VSVVRAPPSVVYRVRCAGKTGSARELRQDSVPSVPQDGCCVSSFGEPFCLPHLPSAWRASGGLGRVPEASVREINSPKVEAAGGARLGRRLNVLRFPSFLPPSIPPFPHPPAPPSLSSLPPSLLPSLSRRRQSWALAWRATGALRVLGNRDSVYVLGLLRIPAHAPRTHAHWSASALTHMLKCFGCILALGLHPCPRAGILARWPSIRQRALSLYIDIYIYIYIYILYISYIRGITHEEKDINQLIIQFRNNSLHDAPSKSLYLCNACAFARAFDSRALCVCVLACAVPCAILAHVRLMQGFKASPLEN